MDDWKNFNLQEVAKEMDICQSLSLTFPFFQKTTGLTPQFVFSCLNDTLTVDILFSPREPNEKEWNSFIKLLMENEEFVRNNKILNDIERFQNIDQLKFKLFEDLKIISKKRLDYYKNEKE